MTMSTLSKFLKKLCTRKNFKQITAYIALLLLCVGGFLFSKNQYNKEASIKIMEAVTGFYVLLNDGDFASARYYYTDGRENDTYLLNLKAKMKTINTTHVSVKKIFPPLVNNKVALVAYSIDQTNNFNGEAYFLREFTVKFLVKEKGDWKFAARKDLIQYKEDEIEKMLQYYRDFLKDDSFVESFKELSRNKE